MWAVYLAASRGPAPNCWSVKAAGACRQRGWAWMRSWTVTSGGRGGQAVEDLSAERFGRRMGWRLRTW